MEFSIFFEEAIMMLLKMDKKLKRMELNSRETFNVVQYRNYTNEQTLGFIIKMPFLKIE